MADPSVASPTGFDAELLLKQARAYLAFGEQIRQFTDRFQDALEQEADWKTAARRQFEQFKEAIAQSAHAPGVNSDLAQLSAMTVDAWQQAALALDIPAPSRMPIDRNSVAWRTYQQTQNHYLDLLQQTAGQAGQTINSLRELYNLWVECNEETYGRMLRSAEYSELSGRLLNALLVCYPRREAAP